MDSSSTVSQALVPASQAFTVIDPENPNTEALLPYQGSRPEMNAHAPAPTRTTSSTGAVLDADSTKACSSR